MKELKERAVKGLVWNLRENRKQRLEESLGSIISSLYSLNHTLALKFLNALYVTDEVAVLRVWTAGWHMLFEWNYIFHA